MHARPCPCRAVRIGVLARKQNFAAFFPPGQVQHSHLTLPVFHTSLLCSKMRGLAAPTQGRAGWSEADKLYVQARLEGRGAAGSWICGGHGAVRARVERLSSGNAAGRDGGSRDAPSIATTREEAMVRCPSRLRHSVLLTVMERDAEEQERLVPLIGMMLDESLSLAPGALLLLFVSLPSLLFVYLPSLSFESGSWCVAPILHCSHSFSLPQTHSLKVSCL